MAGSDRMNNNDNSNPITRLVKVATKIEPNELRATILSFLFAFSIMAAYFILRPVRDALSSDWTDEQLSWLWTSTFFFSALAVSLYGAVISHVRLRVIVPGVYIFFSLTLVGFYFGGTTLGDNDLLNRAYYVWASVLGLFHLSVFWTFMSGLYNKEQAKRLFGIIGIRRQDRVAQHAARQCRTAAGSPSVDRAAGPAARNSTRKRRHAGRAGKGQQTRRESVLRFCAFREQSLLAVDRRIHLPVRDDEHVPLLRVAQGHG
jgi:hypothetical protein